MGLSRHQSLAPTTGTPTGGRSSTCVKYASAKHCPGREPIELRHHRFGRACVIPRLGKAASATQESASWLRVVLHHHVEGHRRVGQQIYGVLKIRMFRQLARMANFRSRLRTPLPGDVIEPSGAGPVRPGISGSAALATGASTETGIVFSALAFRSRKRSYHVSAEKDDNDHEDDDFQGGHPTAASPSAPSVEKMTKERRNPRRSAYRLANVASGADAPGWQTGARWLGSGLPRPQQAFRPSP
jgi:hypothetical protein